MEKAITISYSEYESMVDLIKSQQEAIKEFQKDSRVILIDARFHAAPKLNWYHGYVPKVIGDEVTAKEYMKTEFDGLSEKFKHLNSSYEEYMQKNPPKEHFSFWR